MTAIKPEHSFWIIKTTGFCLLFVLWIAESSTAGFFLTMALVLMSLARWRYPQLRATLLLDVALCLLVIPHWELASYALLLVLFEGFYRRFYWTFPASLASLYFINSGDLNQALNYILFLALAALVGFFLAGWRREQREKLKLRDTHAGKYYELKQEQSELLTALPKVEHMTVLAERARIARDLHDNAGHEIVAAYISLQTARQLLDAGSADTDTLELYDAALSRLDKGVKQIRETAHNLQTVNSLGVETLLETCEKFPICPVEFKSYGDSSRIPVYVWNMLEACLNESLTNVSRHANAGQVKVELDTAKYLVRLMIENDGAKGAKATFGSGLRNLHQRAIAIGGSLSVDAGEHFRVVCVIPIRAEDAIFSTRLQIDQSKNEIVATDASAKAAVPTIQEKS